METFPALLALSAGKSPVTGEIPSKSQYAALCCFLWSAPEQTNEYTIETPMISDVITLIISLL